MTRRTLAALAAVLLLAGPYALPAHAATTTPAELSGTVTWIYDADTVDVAPHGTVRVLGIDAPEKDPSERDRNFTKLGILPKRLRAAHGAGIAYGIEHLKGQTVTLVTDGTPRDRFGRLLVYVILPDGRSYNRLLLEEGLVIVYRRFDFAHKDDFLAAEADARRRGVGLWSR